MKCVFIGNDYTSVPNYWGGQAPWVGTYYSPRVKKIFIFDAFNNLGLPTYQHN